MKKENDKFVTPGLGSKLASLLHLWLSLIAFMVVQFITFMVSGFITFAVKSYCIYGQFLLHLWPVIQLLLP